MPSVTFCSLFLRCGILLLFALSLSAMPGILCLRMPCGAMRLLGFVLLAIGAAAAAILLRVGFQMSMK